MSINNNASTMEAAGVMRLFHVSNVAVVEVKGSKQIPAGIQTGP